MDDDESEKTLVLYMKDETVLDLCDDGTFSSEQGDFEKAQRQTWPQLDTFSKKLKGEKQ